MLTQADADNEAAILTEMMCKIDIMKETGTLDKAYHRNYLNRRKALLRYGYNLVGQRGIVLGRKAWILKAEPLMVQVNMNPEGKDINDCTTRALTYILTPRGLTYAELRKEQNSAAINSRGSAKYWNYANIWHHPLTTRGYTRIEFTGRQPTRTTVAKCLSRCAYPMAVESIHHVAVIEAGKIIDSWNSKGGHVTVIYVPTEHVDEVKALLPKEVFDQTCAPKPYHRRSWW